MRFAQWVSLQNLRANSICCFFLGTGRSNSLIGHPVLLDNRASPVTARAWTAVGLDQDLDVAGALASAAALAELLSGLRLRVASQRRISYVVILLEASSAVSENIITYFILESC
jgi:hypothetical protein